MGVLRLRQKRELINHIRNWFKSQGFFEIETPLLVPSPGMEVHLQGFETCYVDERGTSHRLFLPTSPEFAIKKALGTGEFSKVFEIARVFRNNGEASPLHHPEFNMLEWYRPGSYLDIMSDVENFLAYAATHFSGTRTPGEFTWTAGVRRKSVASCFSEFADLDMFRGQSDSAYWLKAAAEAIEEEIPVTDSFEDIFFRVWMKLVEPQLGKHQPEIVYDYPVSMAALSKVNSDDPRTAERFELYIQGVEIGNAFSELTDSREQEKRFRDANSARASQGYPPHPLDNRFIDAVGKMPATGGIAIGIERLLMVLTEEDDIRNCFLDSLFSETTSS